jgi:hypothetical protein
MYVRIPGRGNQAVTAAANAGAAAAPASASAALISSKRTYLSLVSTCFSQPIREISLMKDMTNAANTMLSNKEKADLEAIGANPFSTSASTSTTQPPHPNGGFTQPAGDHPQPGQEWDYICHMSGRTDGAVKVVTHVAHEANVTET